MLSFFDSVLSTEELHDFQCEENENKNPALYPNRFSSEMTKMPLRDLNHANVNLNWVKSRSVT